VWNTGRWSCGSTVWGGSFKKDDISKKVNSRKSIKQEWTRSTDKMRHREGRPFGAVYSTQEKGMGRPEGCG